MKRVVIRNEYLMLATSLCIVKFSVFLSFCYELYAVSSWKYASRYSPLALFQRRGILTYFGGQLKKVPSCPLYHKWKYTDTKICGDN